MVLLIELGASKMCHTDEQQENVGVSEYSGFVIVKSAVFLHCP